MKQPSVLDPCGAVPGPTSISGPRIVPFAQLIGRRLDGQLKLTFENETQCLTLMRDRIALGAVRTWTLPSSRLPAPKGTRSARMALDRPAESRG